MNLVLAQLYTWAVFGGLYVLSFDKAIKAALQRMQARLSNGGSLDPAYSTALGVSALLAGWLYMLSYAGMLVAVAVAVGMVTRMFTFSRLPTNILHFLFSPMVNLHCLDVPHWRAHGAIAIAATMYLIVKARLVWQESIDVNPANAKAQVWRQMRLLLYETFTIILLLYGAYALYSMLQAPLMRIIAADKMHAAN